jgi:hypothetical protein
VTAEEVAVLRTDLVALDRLLTERFTASERALALRLEATERALDIATKETHRRLDLLNGEQGRLQAERDKFLARLEFEEFRRDYNRRHDELERSLDLVQKQQAESVSRDRTVAFLFGAAVAVAGIVLGLLGK